jgi:hypothetical protein
MALPGPVGRALLGPVKLPLVENGWSSIKTNKKEKAGVGWNVHQR